jgi:hypothetical protein
MDRRSDDRIRELCAKILATEDQDEVINLCFELKKEIQNHVRHFRERISDYSLNREKRKGSTDPTQSS